MNQKRQNENLSQPHPPGGGVESDTDIHNDTVMCYLCTWFKVLPMSVIAQLLFLNYVMTLMTKCETWHRFLWSMGFCRFGGLELVAVVAPMLLRP